MKQIIFNTMQVVPSKVVCIGRNYVEHIEELGNETPESMVVFNKPNSAITDTLHFISEDTRFEGEICFLIQNKQIAGIGFGLDLTKAEIQNKMKEKGLPWERAKAFDGSAVLGEFVPFRGDLKALRMELLINGRLVQFADYALMIYKPLEMLAEIERFMSFEDGDIVMSGTPKGVGNYSVGDEFTGRVYEGERLLVESSWRVR
ncbi:fumarylacetoacetate hydrolase family protein [Sulfurovum sp.]|jgi:2-keto-4-pentenoate hydratase/2-oxohepta-3-ene-1,7-dioic acid hydratase in catechol pathway|uniref:fumarylacetoacetate hydrolase family protein n=1 Tax=Sulfurovum sp. TaxID=1969726 RepID=UPI002A35B42E|nr:fumarylacetoacetate hydrolase family protein [Sulfurovum sp.]MDD2450709.1 fumarylacetoacetate hydrolase family protein [Sulfurovum sp.]MDD3499425.1 fumarylacetoacetate hydrolase family protein [Sulfurovum sp.]MDY0403535.1 fumarylacetoacetate hydrolase family protein [Sulfurovum sp.]